MQPELEGNAYDLINAVNALRSSNGLSSYSINSILMYTAQSQADFMAETGNVSHTGAGGSSVTDRLLAAGYPLAGDLSFGGFRSENILSGVTSMSAQAAVNAWTGDSAHLNTMLSPNLTEIGAGVTVASARVYYVIDCAQPTTGGAPQGSRPVPGSGSTVPARDATIPVIVPSTPNVRSEVIHEVRPGQTLWQIAISYGVKVDDIKGLNNLQGNNIYPGDKLLITRNVILPTASPTETQVSAVTASPTNTFMATATPLSPTSTLVPKIVPSTNANNNSIMSIAIGIIALALLGGGVFMWLGNSKRE